jgi:hypothetical protein
MREDYIEEVSETIARSICPIYREDCDEYQPHTCTKCFIFSTPIGCLAEDLYNAGYRKQSEGEWIDKPTGAYGRWQSWCSACGKHSGIGGIESNRHKPFCPNCGAKMKGGE